MFCFFCQTVFFGLSAVMVLDVGAGGRVATARLARALVWHLAEGQPLLGGGGATRRVGEPRRGAPAVGRNGGLVFHRGSRSRNVKDFIS